jgi:hypothetical protein
LYKDVTPLFDTYRECARHLRNTYFCARGPREWDPVEEFSEVADLLFQRLVLDRLTTEYDPANAKAAEQNRLLIVPVSIRMPVMLSRDKGAHSGHWDHPVECLKPGDAAIGYRELFDWDEHALTDFRYYRGVILASPAHPEIVGHEALIETIHGRIDFEVEAGAPCP